jgi:hypothetical protein
MDLYLQACTEYMRAADDLARKGLKGEIGDPLPLNMSPLAVEMINDDPEEFQREVRLAAYAQAMNRI